MNEEIHIQRKREREVAHRKNLMVNGFLKQPTKYAVWPLVISLALALLVVTQIAAAAANDTFQMPSFSQGWSSLPENVAGMAIKVLGIIFALVVIVVLANVLRGGGEYSVGRMGHDSGQSAGGMDRIIRSVAAIILLLIGVALVIWLVS